MRQQTKRSPRQKTNKMNPLIIPARSLESSRPRHREGKPRQRPENSELCRQSAQLGGQGGQSSHGRGPEKSAPLRECQGLQRSATWQEGMRKLSEPEEQGRPQAHNCPETAPVPTVHRKRADCSEGLNVRCGGKFVPDQNAALVPPTEIRSKTARIKPFLSSSNVS